MKLLIIASLPQISTANYFISAFKHSGHALLVCSDVAAPQVDVLCQGLVDVNALMSKHAFAADAVLFFEGGSMRLLPDTTRGKPCPAVWYAIDTHMDFDKHVRIGRLFDMTFVAQKQYVEQLTAHGVRQVHWLPLAFAPELMPPVVPSRDIDIAYVGSENAVMHPLRSALLTALRNEFPSTQFGRATPKQMGQIYASARIVFNRAINNDVNMRFFEAMGAGAVLLTDRIIENGVEDLFEEGRHYVTYGDQTELLQIARGLLADPDRLREIGDAARDLILANHTYQHRADQMVAKLQDAAKLGRPAASDLFAASLSMGLTADALRAGAAAMGNVGGGRFQRSLGVASAVWIRIAAWFVARIDRTWRILRGRRNG